jgi:hypothetical protein
MEKGGRNISQVVFGFIKVQATFLLTRGERWIGLSERQ